MVGLLGICFLVGAFEGATEEGATEAVEEGREQMGLFSGLGLLLLGR